MSDQPPFNWPPAPPQPSWRCKWAEDEHGVWGTDCKNEFVFETGTPKENKAEYCMFCGRPILQYAYVSDEVREQAL